ncbi:hypothetical protein ScPMuIL_010656 [Solemya velum]
MAAKDKNYFAAEVSLLQELRHPRVVQLIGVCTTLKLPVIVLEYLPGGNLYQRLHMENKQPLDHVEYYQTAQDVSQGLNYLHQHKPAILHLDLKSLNVLVDSSGQAKITDFGFSKLRHDAIQRLSQYKRPKVHTFPVWTAPEVLMKGEITAKADVFSFGIILWEMLTQQKPYDGCSIYQILERVRKNHRPELPTDCPKELGILIQKCWHQNPVRRPTFTKILSILENLTFPREWRALFQEACVPNGVLEDMQSARSIVRLVSDTLIHTSTKELKSDQDQTVKRPNGSSLCLSLEQLNSDQSSETNKNLPEKKKAETRFDTESQILHNQAEVELGRLAEITEKNVSEHVNYIVSESKNVVNKETLRTTQRSEVSDTDSSDLVTVTDSVELSFEKESDVEISDLESISSDDLSLVDSLEDYNQKDEKYDSNHFEKSISRVIESERESRVAWTEDVEVLCHTDRSDSVADGNANNPIDSTWYSGSQTDAAPLCENTNLLKEDKFRHNSVGTAGMEQTEELHVNTIKTAAEFAAPAPLITPDLLSLGIHKLKLLPGNKNGKSLCKSPTRKNLVRDAQNSSFIVKSVELQNCKKHLRPVTNPHPSQLADLKCVQEETLSSIAEIIKRAVSERRFAVGGEESLENSRSSLTWSFQD